MLLLGALFALFIVGLWLYCLVDVALTPGRECRAMPRGAWIAVIAGTFAIGAVMWLVVRRPARPTVPPALPGNDPGDPSPPHAAPAGRRTVRHGPHARNGHHLADGAAGGEDRPVMADRPAADAALLRHPAGRSRIRRAASQSRPHGPDDDPEFLRSLSRAIHGAEPGDDRAGGPDGES
jgi:hypothetical protein